MGDVAFFYVTPLAFEGHIGAWIKVCERILAMDDVETLVPGHGPAGTKDDLRAMLGYLQLVRTGARKAFDAEVPAGEAARSIDLGEYAEWCEPERLNANVGRLYAEFRGELESIL
jgi:glyoxylase-like metal-dependent hydrolase (beta-lactamase superfamily II)